MDTPVANLKHVFPVIKVIGLGRGGGLAVERMMNRGMNAVELIVAHTDFQQLSRNPILTKLALRETGLASCLAPERGLLAARASEFSIKRSLQGADMVFITAGMGGGTGMGAAPVFAEIAREMGALTVGVTTLPFSFEGKMRMNAAEAGVAELSKHVDSLIVIRLDNLLKAMSDAVDIDDCFSAADEILSFILRTIAGIMTEPGLVDVDLAEMRAVFGNKKRAAVGLGSATGENRAQQAAERAGMSPILDGFDLSTTQDLLVIITAEKSNLKMKELNEAINVVKALVTKNARIIFGVSYEKIADDALHVTIIATSDGLTASGQEISGGGGVHESNQKPVQAGGVSEFSVVVQRQSPALCDATSSREENGSFAQPCRKQGLTMPEQSSLGKVPARSLLCTGLGSVFLRVARQLLARCDGSFDVLFPQALAVVLRTGNFSISHLQRRLLLGYRRACRLMAAVEAANVVPRNPHGRESP